MKASLQLKIGQSLTMTPQLQQAIRLLQLSTMELETEIQDALDSNMMLELDEDHSQQNNSENENSDSSAQPESNTNETVDSKDKTTEIHTSETETGLNNDTIPTELPVDSVWEDIYDNSGSFSKSLGNSEYNSFDNQDSESLTLSGHLLWQLNLTPTSDTDKAIATAIIDALDDEGYLTCSLEDILASLGDEHELEVEMDEVEAVLRLVQSMEPTGVAARHTKAGAASRTPTRWCSWLYVLPIVPCYTSALRSG